MKQNPPSLALLHRLGIDIEDEDAYLEHYGVKGMRWGVRKSVDDRKKHFTRSLKQKYPRAAERREVVKKARSKGTSAVRKQHDKIFDKEMKTGKMASDKDYAKLDAAKKSRRAGVKKAKKDFREGKKADRKKRRAERKQYTKDINTLYMSDYKALVDTETKFGKRSAEAKAVVSDFNKRYGGNKINSPQMRDIVAAGKSIVPAYDVK